MQLYLNIWIFLHKMFLLIKWHTQINFLWKFNLRNVHEAFISDHGVIYYRTSRHGYHAQHWRPISNIIVPLWSFTPVGDLRNLLKNVEIKSIISLAWKFNPLYRGIFFAKVLLQLIYSLAEFRIYYFLGR